MLDEPHSAARFPDGWAVRIATARPTKWGAVQGWAGSCPAAADDARCIKRKAALASAACRLPSGRTSAFWQLSNDRSWRVGDVEGARVEASFTGRFEARRPH